MDSQMWQTYQLKNSLLSTLLSNEPRVRLIDPFIHLRERFEHEHFRDSFGKVPGIHWCSPGPYSVVTHILRTVLHWLVTDMPQHVHVQTGLQTGLQTGHQTKPASKPAAKPTIAQARGYNASRIVMHGSQ